MSTHAKVEGRAALFLPNLEGGGAERMMVALARGLSARGVEVDLVLAKAYGPYLDEIPSTVRLVDLNASGVVASIPGLVNYIRGARPVAAIGTLPYASLALLWSARLAGTGTRVYIREASTPSMVRPELTDLKGRLIQQLARIFFPRADGVIAVSNGVEEDLKSFIGVPSERLTIIYNPVVSEELQVLASREVEHPWLAPGQAPVILSVGRMSPEKDFVTLIRAFAEVRSKRPVRLLILGEGPERSRLEGLIESLGIEGDVQLPGFEPNPFSYMKRASVYALSSTREGLPGSLIQALACGCPVVSTDCPHGPHEVLEGGRFGKLVPVGDHAALAHALLEVIENRPDPVPLIQRSNHFSEERSINAYIELLFSGVGSSASTRSPVGMKG